MRRARRRLSDRMLRLTRWYSTGSRPYRALTQAEMAAVRRWSAPSYAQKIYSATHGRSRRDGTRP